MSAPALEVTVAELAEFFEQPLEAIVADSDGEAMHDALLFALESGSVRAARRGIDGAWSAVPWVKRGILAGFRRSTLVEMLGGCGGPAFDRAAFPPRGFTLDARVRLVPGGSAVRRGAHVAAGAVVMPPSYINVGAYVGAETMVDSHVLVGSCAQVGSRVHLSAGVQVGGVLEPARARPVIVEDGAFVGGLCGLFEGVVVRRGAVLAAGLILTAATPIYDFVAGSEHRGEVPENAVVVPATRPGRGDFARTRGVALAAAAIVKHRDPGTDAATALEQALRVEVGS